MPANLSIDMLFTLGEAFQRLKTLAGGSGERIGRYVQQIVNDPLYRKQVYLAMAGKLVIDEMTQAEWIEREMAIFSELTTLGLPEITTARLEPAWADGTGSHHRYLPGDWSQRGLLDACQAVGIKMYSLDRRDKPLSTEAGVIECDLTSIMTPTDADHRPFMLNLEQQNEWAKQQGGEGITSVEESLYLLLRARVELGRIPFMGGWIRCRNESDPDESLGVDWYAVGGLWVDSSSLAHCDWNWGAVPRKFRRV